MPGGSALALVRLLSASTVILSPWLVKSFPLPSSVTTPVFRTTCRVLHSHSQRTRRRSGACSNGGGCENSISTKSIHLDGHVMADSVSSTCLRSSRDRNADTTEEERVRTTDATGPSSLATDLARNARELFRSAWLAAEPLMGGKAAETADAQQAAIVELVEKIRARQSGEISVSDDGGALRTAALELRRYQLLARLMRSDYDAYVATASFLSPGLISREGEFRFGDGLNQGVLTWAVRGSIPGWAIELVD